MESEFCWVLLERRGRSYRTSTKRWKQKEPLLWCSPSWNSKAESPGRVWDTPEQLDSHSPSKPLQNKNSLLTVVVISNKMPNYLPKTTRKAAKECQVGTAGSEYGSGKPGIHSFFLRENLPPKKLSQFPLQEFRLGFHTCISKSLD